MLTIDLESNSIIPTASGIQTEVRILTYLAAYSSAIRAHIYGYIEHHFAIQRNDARAAMAVLLSKGEIEEHIIQKQHHRKPLTIYILPKTPRREMAVPMIGGDKVFGEDAQTFKLPIEELELDASDWDDTLNLN